MSWQVHRDQLTMRRKEGQHGVPSLPSMPDPVQEHKWQSCSQPLIGQPHVTPLPPEWFFQALQQILRRQPVLLGIAVE